MSRRRLITIVLAAGLAGIPVVTGVAPATAGSSASVTRSVAAPTPAPSPTVKPTPKPTVKPTPKPAPKPTTKPAPTTVAGSRPLLRPGARGVAVTTLQTRLAKLGYWLGAPSGRYDHTTAQAVMALQKVAGLGRDGVTGPATWAALDRGIRPTPRSARGRVLEVDLKRQVLLFAVDGKLKYVINTSTGTKATPTPRGLYRIFRQQDGWRTAPLGKLYRPKYFHRGYAVHGVTDGHIPGYPASHGCTRVSMKAMDMMWAKGGLRYNDRVWVY